VDFADFGGFKWLIMVDAKSKFLCVHNMRHSTTAEALCTVFDEIFINFGIPETIVSDNGPPFNSHVLEGYYALHGIAHVTSPAYHPQSNGLAERAVRSFKESMVRLQAEGYTMSQAVQIFLRDIRWRPHTITGQIPAEQLLSRAARTDLARLHTPPLAKYKAGDAVWVKLPLQKHSWSPGRVIRVIGSRVYEVQLSDGRLWKRHQDQLRKATTASTTVEIEAEIDPLHLSTALVLPSAAAQAPAAIVSPAPAIQVQQRRYPDRVRHPPPKVQIGLKNIPRKT